jgi:hypothetical protein
MDLSSPRTVIKEINAAWTKDSRINQLDLEGAAASGQTLHAKYLEYLTEARILIADLEKDYQELRKIKKRFYNSELTKKELEEHGWTPYNKNKPLKTELAELLEGDDDLLVIVTKLEHLKTLRAQTEEIMKATHDRTYSITSTVRMRTFEHGE